MFELSESKVCEFEEFRLDAKSHRLFRRESGEVVPLTPKAVELLLVLIQNRDRVLTKDELLDKVWGIEFVGTERTVDQHITQLRQHLGDSLQHPQYLETLRGKGYRMRVQA